jgi:hypothetical protein
MDWEIELATSGVIKVLALPESSKINSSCFPMNPLNLMVFLFPGL